MSGIQTIEHEPTKAVAAAKPGMTPMEMIGAALSNGQGVEMVEKLMELQERWQANEGRKAYDAAMSAAKSEIGPILKNRTVDFVSSKGRTHYRHEDLAQIAEQINPILSAHGLSYRYRTEQNNGSVTVHCVVSHRDGYSETTTLSGPVDDTGNKNKIQAIGSTVTFLQRYTLKAALGLSVSNDDDGRAAGMGATISDKQLSKLEDALTGPVHDVHGFLKYMNIESLSDLPANKFEGAMKAIKQKEAALQAKGQANA